MSAGDYMARRIGALMREAERYQWEPGQAPTRRRHGSCKGPLSIREMAAMEAQQCPRVPGLIGRVVFIHSGKPDAIQYTIKWHTVVDGYLLCKNAQRVYASKHKVSETQPQGKPIFTLCSTCVNRARRSPLRPMLPEQLQDERIFR